MSTSSRYTSIRVSVKTKRLLEKVPIKMESLLGGRLDYDELLRILAEEELREDRKPWLLITLYERPITNYNVEKALEVLRRREGGTVGSRVVLDASVIIDILAGPL